MTVVGLHPEELFDKLLDGELTPGERERLRQHLDGCEVCRFEYAARLDFQAEALQLQASASPPALPLRPPLVAGEERSTPVPAATPRRRRSRALIWGLAAAALITTGGAVASGLTGHAPWNTLGTLFSQTSAHRAVAAAPAKAAPAAVRVAATPEATATATETPAPVAATPAEVAVAPAAPTATEPASKAVPLRHGVTGHAPVAPAAEAAPTVLSALPAHAEMPVVKEIAKDPAKEPSSAAKLFGEANQARRSGDIGRASGLYHLLQDQFPGSPEADLSRVTLALLLLDSGDARGALSGFERYLAGSSRALEAEALVGRARALGRLGRRDQEAVAWREVQRKYPRSIYGRQANERLAALGQP